MADQQDRSGTVTVTVEYDDETWDGNVQLGQVPFENTDGTRHYFAEVTRDGDNLGPCTWTVPPGGRTIEDGALFANAHTRRLRIALLTLSASVRRVARTSVYVIAGQPEAGA